MGASALTSHNTSELVNSDAVNVLNYTICSLPADVRWGSVVTHSGEMNA